MAAADDDDVERLRAHGFMIAVSPARYN
jgi:hypothetical protein